MAKQLVEWKEPLVIENSLLAHSVVWPEEGTHADFTYINQIRKHFSRRVIVVFDDYAENAYSIKEYQTKSSNRITVTVPTTQKWLSSSCAYI